MATKKPKKIKNYAGGAPSKQTKKREGCKKRKK